MSRGEEKAEFRDTFAEMDAILREIALRRAKVKALIEQADAVYNEQKNAGFGYDQPLDVGAVTPAGMAGPGDIAGSPWVQNLLRMLNQ